MQHIIGPETNDIVYRIHYNTLKIPGGYRFFKHDLIWQVVKEYVVMPFGQIEGYHVVGCV